MLFVASGGWGLGLLADLGAGEAAEQAAVLDADRWAVTLGAGPELLEWLHLAAPVLDKPAPWRWRGGPTGDRRTPRGHRGRPARRLNRPHQHPQAGRLRASQARTAARFQDRRLTEP